jgi:hypothetical protein
MREHLRDQWHHAVRRTGGYVWNDTGEHVTVKEMAALLVEHGVFTEDEVGWYLREKPQEIRKKVTPILYSLWPSRLTLTAEPEPRNPPATGFDQEAYDYVTRNWDRGEAKAASRPKPSKLYHLTSTMHWPVIAQSGELRTTESNIDISGAGPPVVWLTTNPAPGPAWAAGGFKGEVVIDVRAPFVQWWPEWSRDQGIEEFWYEALASSGGDPEEWWVSLRPIPYSDWRSVRLNPSGQTLWLPEDGHPAEGGDLLDDPALGSLRG